MNTPVNDFTLAEEIWHAITHGIGLVLSITGLATLVAYAAISGSTISVISSVIYGSTLIILYGASTLYHAITDKKIKKLFQIFDHASIYLLIAGTYTPVTLVALGGSIGWSIFIINWMTAIFGIYMKFAYPGRFEKLSLVLYLLMGWLIVVAMEPLIEAVDATGIQLLVAGGLAYTFGVVFYVKDSKPYFHAIWHLFVMAGSIFHYLMILLYVV